MMNAEKKPAPRLVTGDSVPEPPPSAGAACAGG